MGNDIHAEFHYQPANPIHSHSDGWVGRSVNCVSYAAASYAWGRNQSTRSIRIYRNGFRTSLEVNVNVWMLLQILRAKWGYVWIDAICINQADSKEKSAQVAMMADIYRNASTVAVYLGVAPTASHLTLNQQIRPQPSVNWSDCMDIIANRPYWSRLWIIQEFTLARNLEIICGNEIMDEFDFKDMLARATGVDFYDREMSTAGEYTKRFEEWNALTVLLGRHNRLLTNNSLYALLVRHANAQCEDVRDKLFGLLGLLSDNDREWLPKWFPDYSLSNQQIILVIFAYLNAFANDKPISKILDSLGLHNAKTIGRVLRAVEQLPLHFFGSGCSKEEQIWFMQEMEEEYNRPQYDAVKFDIDNNTSLQDLFDQKNHAWECTRFDRHEKANLFPKWSKRLACLALVLLLASRWKGLHL